MSHRRTTILPSLSSTTATTNPSSSSSSSYSTSTTQIQRNRQYTHLASQLAQLNAHLADTENLLRVTSCQADVVRGLGAWMGGLFMAASKVLGEEGVAAAAAASTGTTTVAAAAGTGAGPGAGFGEGVDDVDGEEREGSAD